MPQPHFLFVLNASSDFVWVLGFSLRVWKRGYFSRKRSVREKILVLVVFIHCKKVLDDLSVCQSVVRCRLGYHQEVASLVNGYMRFGGLLEISIIYCLVA